MTPHWRSTVPELCDGFYWARNIERGLLEVFHIHDGKLVLVGFDLRRDFHTDGWEFWSEEIGRPEE